MVVNCLHHLKANVALTYGGCLSDFEDYFVAIHIPRHPFFYSQNTTPTERVMGQIPST